MPPGPAPYGGPAPLAMNGYPGAPAAPALASPPIGRKAAQGGPSLVAIGAIAFLLIGGVVSLFFVVRSHAASSDKPIPTVDVPAPAAVAGEVPDGGVAPAPTDPPPVDTTTPPPPTYPTQVQGNPPTAAHPTATTTAAHPATTTTVPHPATTTTATKPPVPATVTKPQPPPPKPTAAKPAATAPTRPTPTVPRPAVKIPHRR